MTGRNAPVWERSAKSSKWALVAYTTPSRLLGLSGRDGPPHPGTIARAQSATSILSRLRKCPRRTRCLSDGIKDRIAGLAKSGDVRGAVVDRCVDPTLRTRPVRAALHSLVMCDPTRRLNVSGATPNGLKLLDQVRAVGVAANRHSPSAAGPSHPIEAAVVIAARDVQAAFHQGAPYPTGHRGRKLRLQPHAMANPCAARLVRLRISHSATATFKTQAAPINSALGTSPGGPTSKIHGNCVTACVPALRPMA